MVVELQINNSLDPAAQFVTWSAAPCRIRMTDPTGTVSKSVRVRLTCASSATGGVVLFSKTGGRPFRKWISLWVPSSGASLTFFVAGKFGRPSTNPGDVTIFAKVGQTLVGSAALMVRIRKNANTLTNDERDRFVAAFAQLNNQGLGRFADFRDMHTSISSPQAHGAPAFLPWHRAYLLDLERELQAIDPSVALPYWRFDEAAPNVFTQEFLGISDALGNVQFAPSSPLRFWRTDGVPGVARRPFFNTVTASADVISQDDTLGLGTAYADFVELEGNPHGSAHVSFGGSISSIHTAARDPLFFLLHCNVDRLWAKWQKQNDRFDPAVAESFDGEQQNPLGHNLLDTMWPWNGDTNAPRPPSAPGGTLADSVCVSAPGPMPMVRDCLDYRGTIDPIHRMGFDYDDLEIV